MTIRALLVSGRKLELELHHTRLGPPVRYEDSTPTATSYTSVILALPTATRRVAPRPPPSRCASPRPRQCQSVTPPPSPPVVPAPSVRAGFPGNSLTTRRTPRQRKDDSGPAWPHWLWLSTRLPRANASGHPTTCRRRTAPPGPSSALGSASAAACGWSQRGGLRHFGRRNRSTSTPPRAPLPVTRQSSRRPGGALG
jgi:hypothetical protein